MMDGAEQRMNSSWSGELLRFPFEGEACGGHWHFPPHCESALAPWLVVILRCSAGTQAGLASRVMFKALDHWLQECPSSAVY